jgi:hypothetical protein
MIEIVNLIGVIDIFLLILYFYLFNKANNTLTKLYILFGGLNELCWMIDILFERLLSQKAVNTIVYTSYIFDWFVTIFGIMIIMELVNLKSKKIRYIIYGISLIFLISLILFPPNQLNTSQFVVSYNSTIGLGISSIVFLSPLLVVLNEILLGNKIKYPALAISIASFIIGEEIIGSLVFVGFWQGYLTEAAILIPLIYHLYKEQKV